MSERNDWKDVRCILLCKAFQAEYDVFDNYTKLLKEGVNSQSLVQYTALGEFDAIYTIQLDSPPAQGVRSGILGAIANENEQLSRSSSKLADSIFLRPLYLVSTSSNQKKMIEEFWQNDEYPFFFVTIVHARHCSADFKTMEIGRDRIHALIMDSKNNRNASFEFHVYYSLDLSDYIIVWKSIGPRQVLEALRDLYQKTNLVGYTNTICGLPRKTIHDAYEIVISNNSTASKKLQELIGKNPGDGFSASIRAVSKTYDNVKKLHDTITASLNAAYSGADLGDKNKPYFVLGNDDYFGFFPDISPRSLYALHAIITEDKEARKAILSINTTLALPSYNEPAAPRTTLNDIPSFAYIMQKKLEGCCKDLMVAFKGLMTESEGAKHGVFSTFPWPKPALELVTQLGSMSKSTVFDSVCFLGFDSAHLFFAWLLHILKKYEGDPEGAINELTKNEAAIERFVREWDQLSDHVVRLDGTLRQTPGYEPQSYSMSASIVEYCNAYTQKLINYFTGLDIRADATARASRLASFVVPRLCRRLKTEQWFYDKHRMDSMLFITIPLPKIYDMRFIMIALTHEVSHYCADEIRLRERRYFMFVACVAMQLCLRLGVYKNDAIGACNDVLLELVDESKYTKMNEGDRYYLKHVKAALKQCVVCLLEDSEKTQRIHTAFCSAFDGDPPQGKTELAIQIHRASFQIIAPPPGKNLENQSELPPINDQIDDVAYFFKEGFADLMMIHVLSLDPAYYIEALFSEARNLSVKENRGKLLQLYQRMLSVAEAAMESGQWTREDFESCAPPDVYDESKEKDFSIDQFFWKTYRAWTEAGESADWLNCYPKDIILMISRYLRECLTEAKKSEETFDTGLLDERKKIKEAFIEMTTSSDNLFSRQFQGILHENRENILNRWRNRETDPFLFA